MISNKLIGIWGILLGSIVFGQLNQDARMLGMNGSYTTIARGYQCIGVNPANLAAYNYLSINLLNLNLGLSNNAFSLKNYNTINGANLEDTLSFTYYPKSQFYGMFGGEGIRLMQSIKLPLPILNFSTWNFALTSDFSSNIDMGIPNGFIDLLLLGNPFGSSLSLDMAQNSIVTQDIGFSYGHSFNGFSIGFTLKYILGLFYMGMKSIETPFITTNINGFTGQNQYLIQQALGGDGKGLDIGFTTSELKDGYRFGLSVINLLGTVNWAQDHFIRTELENTLKNSAGDFYLRANEFMYVNMVMDSVTGTSFSQTSGDPLIYYEIYKVIPLEKLSGMNMTRQDSALLITLSDGTYYFPSGGEYKLTDLIGDGDTTYTVNDNFVKYASGGKSPFQTRQPMYLRLGMSRKWEEEAIVVADLITGFSNNYGSSSSWRASFGVEIIRFKDQFLRFGYAIGGITKKSISLGYGRKLGSLQLDIGMSFNGGFSIETAKGIDFAIGFIWKTEKLRKK